MKIDITSLCFGFKITKDNDSGTPAWATSIGQAPKGVCYVDTEREGLDNLVYGMMYKSHSDFENLQVRNVVGVDKKEEPRSDRERMMFSVFDDVYVNGIKLNGKYVLTFEREDSSSHKNRLHICYAKYLTYKGLSNKQTLSEMAHALGCSEDACWFVSEIYVKNQSQLHFTAVVVNENHSMEYRNSKERKAAWDELLGEASKINTRAILPIQQIYYGAPGTGKSHEIKEKTKGEAVIRTTFHPDSDYSTFVGAYKPTMDNVDAKVVPVVLGESGTVFNKNEGTYQEKRIVYQFVMQAFLKAYLGAWKKYADSCSICSTPAVHEFNTGNGRYVINSVGAYDLTLSREFSFPKSVVLKEWPNLWNNGVFGVPTGPQSGKSVQHAIANWISDKIDACTPDKFEEGWQKLVDTVRAKGHVDVQKTQTYIISGVTDDNETLTINVEARGKKRATLQRKFNEYDEAKASKLEKTLIGILTGYSNDFDEAWERLKHDVDKGMSPEVKDESDGQIAPQFLVIEEINRGNCAQIFGDIFQLLDRADNGFSVYPIEADSDLRDAIKIAFEEDDEYLLPNGIDIEGVIDYTSNYGATLSEDVQEGRVLLLPPNLFIWATMNTSDQSLFPIDSAFKRRWDWKYMPIDTKKENWYIKVGNEHYSWTTFLEKVNNELLTDETAEDKHLGFYFCKAENNEIATEKFVGKVLFYLWNDVFKIYGIPSAIGSSKDWGYTKFYNPDGSVNEQKVTDLMKQLKIVAEGSVDGDINGQIEEQL